MGMIRGIRRRRVRMGMVLGVSMVVARRRLMEEGIRGASNVGCTNIEMHLVELWDKSGHSDGVWTGVLRHTRYKQRLERSKAGRETHHSWTMGAFA